MNRTSLAAKNRNVDLDRPYASKLTRPKQINRHNEEMAILLAREKALVAEINSAQSNLEDVRRMMRRIWESENSPTITCADGAFEINPSWWRKNHPDQFLDSMSDEDVVAKWRRILTDEWDRRESAVGAAPKAK